MIEGMFRRSISVLVRRVGDEMILLDTDSEAYFALNAVGSLVFDSFREPTSVSDVIDAVFNTFDVARGRAESEVTSLIEDLVDRGMLEPAPSNG